MLENKTTITLTAADYLEAIANGIIPGGFLSGKTTSMLLDPLRNFQEEADKRRNTRYKPIFLNALRRLNEVSSNR